MVRNSKNFTYSRRVVQAGCLFAITDRIFEGRLGSDRSRSNIYWPDCGQGFDKCSNEHDIQATGDSRCDARGIGCSAASDYANCDLLSCLDIIIRLFHG